jgi:site-specific DNA-methyltransferase (adenine-specific)
VYNARGGSLWLGDCLELMRDIPDGSVDMVLCDLPYGTTACKWDSVIPFEPLWEQYWRVCKPNAAVVLTASQPFTTALIGSQIVNFKYCWVWEKSRPGDIFNAKNKPLKAHEDVCVFSIGATANGSNRKMPYNPQDVGVGGVTTNNPDDKEYAFKGFRPSHAKAHVTHGSNYPRSVIKFPNPNKGGIHPTQKPVDLFEYLICTYTDPGMLVLDNCSGSGTTAIAAIQSDRRWLCIERDPEYFLKSMLRIQAA